ncbi:hypothetical protein HDV05_000939 [Chytridiales sp. JEL 0842]|nr:hypothetical protein HDV05_000939 [Chytridiales sp. JEL 0842]
MQLLTIATALAVGVGAIASYVSTLPRPKLIRLLLKIFNTPVGFYLYTFSLPAPTAPPAGHRRILSKTNDYEYGPFKIIPVPYGEDNYAYLILDTHQNIAVGVDPADSETFLRHLKHHAPNANLEAILCTHHHWDHSAGNRTLASHFSSIKIYGSLTDFPSTHPTSFFWGVNTRVKDKETIQAGRMVFRVLETPCHTRGSLCYYFDLEASLEGVETEGEGVRVSSLFTGDTLFVGGVGKFFEGTAREMRDVVQKLVREVPTETFVWPGHEYAFSNLCFAREVEPGNFAVQSKLKSVQDHQFLNTACIPSLLSDELQHNPFLRVDARYRYTSELWSNAMSKAEEVGVDVDVARSVSKGRTREEKEKRLERGVREEAEAEVVGVLRGWKDVFRVSKEGMKKRD